MLTVAFFIVQCASVLVMILFIHEYKRINHKHEVLIDDIDPGSRPQSTLQSTIVIWIYVILTCTITLGTSAFYLYISS